MIYIAFDFYLHNYNICIEYDGEQHYKEKFSFHDKNNFYDTILHDAIKNSYCEDNKIKLIRIPYWEFKNIETILTQKII